MLPVAVLLAAASLSLAVTVTTELAMRGRTDRRFTVASEDAVDGIGLAMGENVALLRGTAALLADGAISRERFHRYIADLDLPRNHPGLRGVGYAPLTAEADREAVIIGARASGLFDFRIWPPSRNDEPAAPIAYLEPLDARNRAALGFDMRSEERRRAAMDRACDAGRASLTGRVTPEPAIAAPEQPGMVLYVPLYRQGGNPTENEPCTGFALALLRGRDFLSGILDRSLLIRVYDGPSIEDGQLIYEQGSASQWRAARRPQLRSILVAGRPWTLEVAPPTGLATVTERLLAPLLGGLGALFSLGLYLVTRRQIQARRRAEEQAEWLRAKEETHAALLHQEQAARAHAEEVGAQLDSLFEAVPAGLAIFDRQLRYVRLNHAMAEMTGAEAETHLGRRIDEVAPDADPQIQAELEQVVTSGLPRHNESTRRPRAGSEPGAVLARYAPIVVGGEATGVAAVVVDISERKRAEERLREERERLEILYELGKQLNSELDADAVAAHAAGAARLATGAQVAVAAVPDTGTRAVSPALPGAEGAEAKAGAGAEDVNGSRALSLAAWVSGQWPAQPAWCQSLTRVTATTRSGHAVHLAVGHEQPGQQSERDQRLLHGIAQQAAIALENALLLQELQRLLDGIRASNQALERSNRDLDQFAYAVSHDLKAPLRGIGNLAQWIEDDLGPTLSGDSVEHLRLLRERVQRMYALIEGLLQVARAGRRTQKPETVDVAALVGDVVEMLEPQPPACVEIAKGMPVVAAERVLLQQVFQNLIGNGLKHASRPDAVVRVEAKEDDDCWRFSVTDNGPGIPREYQTKVWAMFQTLAGRERGDNTGIGLALVKKVVESRGGRTWLESEPGGGATFYFTWPKRPGAAPPGAGAAQSQRS